MEEELAETTKAFRELVCSTVVLPPGDEEELVDTTNAFRGTVEDPFGSDGGVVDCTKAAGAVVDAMISSLAEGTGAL